MIITITIGRLIPLNAASAYACRSRARANPMASASRRTGQNPRSSGAPDRPSHATPPRKTRRGRTAPAVPPWNWTGSTVVPRGLPINARGREAAPR